MVGLNAVVTMVVWIFLDLRDRSGVVQVVASPDHNVESSTKQRMFVTNMYFAYVVELQNVVKRLSIQTFQQVHMKCTVKSCALNSAKTSILYSR